MQSMKGPLETDSFELIALKNINDGSSEIIFKEWTRMYEDKEDGEYGLMATFGVFCLTEKGVYFLDWDTNSYEYHVLYKLPREQVEALQDTMAATTIWVDSSILDIINKNGNSTGFDLRGKGTVRSILGFY